MSEQRSSAESAQPDDLEQVISSLLRNHSSPTIGQGSIHGGQVGWVLYEPNLAFVVAGIRRYLTKTTVRTEPQSENVEVAIKRMKTLADTALPGRAYEEECQAQLRNACVLLEMAYLSQEDSSPQTAPATVSIRREWLEHVISVLQGDLPSGRIGDVVFLLRDQLRDILDRPAFARSQAESAPKSEAILKAADDMHDLGFEGGWNAAIDECVSAVEDYNSDRKWSDDEDMQNQAYYTSGEVQNEVLNLIRALSRPKCGG